MLFRSIVMPGGAHGGPVFDSAGRLAGIASHAAAGDDRFMPLSALRSELGAMLDVADDAPSQRMPLDEAYERAMRIALQVIVER